MGKIAKVLGKSEDEGLEMHNHHEIPTRDYMAKPKSELADFSLNTEIADVPLGRADIENRFCFFFLVYDFRLIH